MRRPLLTFVATCVLSLCSLHAQTISKELMDLLTRGSGMPNENYNLRMGAPPTFPRELLPRGVLPGASTVSERATVVVAEAPGLTSRDISQHERELTASGWSNMSGMGSRGLVSSNMTAYSYFCKGDQHVTMSYTQRAAGGLNLRVLVNTDPRRGPCAPVGARPMSFFADVDLPNLNAPADSRVMGSGASSGSDHYDQNIRLETKLAPEAVVKHYADQLDQAGWKPTAQVAGAGVAVARFTIVSSTKETIVGVVMATALPADGHVAVKLQLLRIDPNRRFPGRIGGAGAR